MITTIALILSLATSTPEGLFGKKGFCSNGSCSSAVAVEAAPVAPAAPKAAVACEGASCSLAKQHDCGNSVRLFKFRLRGSSCSGGGCR